MSAKDSAEDKLIASIQKTKAQASGQPADASSKPAAKKTVAKKAAGKKATAKKAAPKKAAAKPQSGRAAQSNKEQLVKTFQHGRRVWPD